MARVEEKGTVMSRIKKWFFERFLPEYARQKLLEDNEALRAELNELRQKYDNLKAYTNGLEDGIKAAKRIQIFNGKGA